MLLVFAGLPGVGKTTLARALAEELAATYLRIDIIEQTLRASGVPASAIDAGVGYDIANALAEANLRLGQTVVADAVNPVRIARDGWRTVAAAARCRICEIEVICSDAAEHRRRVETRVGDIAGLVQPSWQPVVDRHVEPWDRPHILIDTAGRTVDETMLELRARVVEARG